MDCLGDTLLVPSPVIIGNNGNHTVVQTEHRHEDKAVQLEIYSEYGSCRCGELNQDLVHSKGHDRADRLHDNGGHAYRINHFDNSS